MAYFSKAHLHDILKTNDILDVVLEVVELKQVGSNYVGLCPFHSERVPSFTVNPRRQIFHCFGCHKGGDVIKFVSDYNKLSFVDAVNRLEERSKVR